MRFLFAIFNILLPVMVFSKPVIEFIPDSRAYGEMLDPNILEKDYNSLGQVQKLQYLIEKAGFEMRQTFLDEMPKNPRFIAKAYAPGGSKENVAFVLCYNHPYFVESEKLNAVPKQKKAVILWEPPCVIPDQYKSHVLDRYQYVWTFRDDLVDGKNFHKFCYPELKSFDPSPVPFEEKKLACLISRNKMVPDPNQLYGLRRAAIVYYESRHQGDFDLYGYGWETEHFKNYKGTIGSKAATMKNYKFAYCFENSRDVPGYITEKIFDCFAVGCVPIYRGANNVTDYIPPGCFIDMRDFSSIEDVHNFISHMSEDEHSKYVDNIKAYLKTKEATQFSQRGFFQAVLSVLARGL